MPSTHLHKKNAVGTYLHVHGQKALVHLVLVVVTYPCCYVMSLQFEPGFKLPSINQDPQFKANVLPTGNATGGMALQADKFFNISTE